MPAPSSSRATSTGVATGTSFCPECGRENPVSVTQCEGCGRGLDAPAEIVKRTGPPRRLRGVVVATVAGMCVATVVLAWFLDLALRFELREVMLVEGNRVKAIEVLGADAGFKEVFGPALGFGLAGLVAALVFAGRYMREVVLGAVAGIAVLFGLWLVTAHLAGGNLRLDLAVEGEGFVMRGPAPILLTQLLLTMLFSAIALAFAGWIAREQITGEATCVHCHSVYPLRPRRPVRCPTCDTEQERDGAQWPWVMLVAAVTALVFGVVLATLRQPLEFAFECQGSPMSEVCRSARLNEDMTVFVTKPGRRASDPFVFWAIDQWRYLELTALLMFAAPLVLTFLVKRGSRASAGALIPINWLLGTFVVMIALGDIGGSEAGFMYLMRMQVLALFVWSGAGIVGVLVGDKLRFRKGSAYLDELDE